MPMRREQVAAALRYLQDKADLRGRFERATSLDPQEQDLADIAVETGASLVPGVGPALAARDFERARRADDEAGMAMAAASAVPGGKLAGLLKRYDPTKIELDVYHGTPHRFPATEANPLGEFDASKIGTGEGAQAYGHGVYLAEAPNVAKGYAENVKDNAAVKAINDEMSALAKVMGREEIVGKYRKYKSDIGTNAAKRYDELMQKRQAIVDSPGTLYKADLPDEMIDRMLDYDKPMSQQPEAVKKILMQDKRLKSLYERGKIDDFYDNAGHFYRTIMAEQRQNAPINLSEEAAEGWAEPLVSERLRQMGIPGIKYLDAGSRGQGGSGTRNFVVFPGEEKKVRILERK